MLILINPEKYGLELAYITEHQLEYKYDGSNGLHSSHSYYLRASHGGKLIFARLFGKGAKWTISND